MLRRNKITCLVLLLLCFGSIPSFGQAQSSSNEYTFRPPSNYVKKFIASDSLDFIRINYGQFELYFYENSYASNHPDQLKEMLDQALQRIMDTLAIDKYRYGIRLIAVDSKDAMKALMGYHIKGGAAVGHDLVFFVFNDEIRPQFKHEIFHLMAFESWGQYSNRLLDEGGATYTDGECLYKNPIKEITAYLNNRDMLFPLTKMISNFDQVTKENDLIAYLQAASLFGYLYEEHGVQKMKQLWKKGFDSFESIYGFTISQFEKEWNNYISEIEITQNINWDVLTERGCG